MANSTGSSAHVNVPAAQPNYDATSEAPVGRWDSVDPMSGPCPEGSFAEAGSDWPSTGVWKQT